MSPCHGSRGRRPLCHQCPPGFRPRTAADTRPLVVIHFRRGRCVACPFFPRRLALMRVGSERGAGGDRRGTLVDLGAPCTVLLSGGASLYQTAGRCRRFIPAEPPSKQASLADEPSCRVCIASRPRALCAPHEHMQSRALAVPRVCRVAWPPRRPPPSALAPAHLELTRGPRPAPSPRTASHCLALAHGPRKVFVTWLCGAGPGGATRGISVPCAGPALVARRGGAARGWGWGRWLHHVAAAEGSSTYSPLFYFSRSKNTVSGRRQVDGGGEGRGVRGGGERGADLGQGRVEAPPRPRRGVEL